MRFKMIPNGGPKTFVLTFDKGDEVVGSLRRFAVDQGLKASHFTAIGALSGVVLGFFDPRKNDYRKITIDEQLELLVLSGDIALKDSEPQVHAHVVVGKADGTAHGGHLLEARVFPTLELVLEESPTHLRRRVDEETGLALIDLDAA